MSQNLISQTMTDAVRDGLIANLTAFDTGFTPYKTSKTPGELASLSKLAAVDLGMLQAAHTYALQNPGAIPANVNVTELAGDIALANQVIPINALAAQKSNLTRNSLIVIMSDGWDTARKIYRIAQAEGRTPENAEFLDLYGAYFDKNPQPPEPPPTP